MNELRVSLDRKFCLPIHEKSNGKVWFDRVETIPQFEEPREVVEDCPRDGGEYEPALEVELLEGVRDGEEALDRHRQRDEHRPHAPDVREAVPE